MIKARTFQYDFAIDGGAIGTIDMRRTTDERRVYTGGVVPDGALVVGMIYRVLTAFTDAAAGAAVTIEVEGQDAPVEFDAAAVANLGTQTKVYWADSGMRKALAKLDADAGVTDTNYAALVQGVPESITSGDKKCQIIIGTEALTGGKAEVTVLYVELDTPNK